MRKTALILIALLTITNVKGQWEQDTVYNFDSTITNAVYVMDFTAKGDTIYATTSNQGIYLSISGTNIWNRVSNIPISYPQGGKAISANQSSVFVGNYDGIYKSNNPLISWVKVDSFAAYIEEIIIIDTLIFAVSSGNAGIDYLGGVYRSDDGGDIWDLFNSGLTDFGVWSITGNDSILFIGNTNGQVFKSIDNGINWIQTSEFDVNSTSIIHHIELVNSTLIAEKSGYLWISTDYGETWVVNFNADFPGGETGISSQESVIVLLESEVQSLHGVSLSTDNGINWTWITYDLPDPTIGNWDWGQYTAIKIIENTIYIGSYLDGIWTLDLNLLTTAKNTYAINDIIVYPNPTNGILNISLKRNEKITIKIHDITGKLLKSLISSSENEIIDIGNFPSGQYIVSIISQRGVLSKTIQLIK